MKERKKLSSGLGQGAAGLRLRVPWNGGGRLDRGVGEERQPVPPERDATYLPRGSGRVESPFPRHSECFCTRAPGPRPCARCLGSSLLAAAGETRREQGPGLGGAHRPAEDPGGSASCERQWGGKRERPGAQDKSSYRTEPTREAQGHLSTALTWKTTHCPPPTPRAPPARPASSGHLPPRRPPPWSVSFPWAVGPHVLPSLSS